MKRLVPLGEVSSLHSIAVDFNDILSRKDNADIADEFPATVARYGHGVRRAVINLTEASASCVKGERELFLPHLGEQVVGLCIVTKFDEVPDGVDTEWPNLSGFIMNPYRGLGLGRFSLEQRLEVVTNNFGNNAWTLVTEGNEVSEHLVQSVGFRKVPNTKPDEKNRLLYTFDASRM
jgi:hypothetical protein